jgi:two-component system sensor histidine kinase DesK
VWLVYVPTMFITPLIENLPTRVWALTGLACLAFLPLYFRAFWSRGREFYVIVALIGLLGALLATVNYSGLALFIYAASFAGTRRPTRLAFSLLALITVVIVVESVLLDLHPFAWLWSVLFVWIVGGVNTHYASLRTADIQLRRAHEEIEHQATVAERERIARDLHDVLGHTLSLITLKASLASRIADRDPARAVEEIRDVERISREALAEVRAAVAGFRDAGLTREIENAKSMLEVAGIQAQVEVQPVELSATEEAVLALAVREGITNVVRHSRATTCTITLSADETTRKLMVADNGGWKRGPHGNGLTGMRERIELIGGALTVATDVGTRLTIELPVRPDPQSRQATDAQAIHIVA